jgi:hypothetical protein
MVNNNNKNSIVGDKQNTSYKGCALDKSMFQFIDFMLDKKFKILKFAWWGLFK